MNFLPPPDKIVKIHTPVYKNDTQVVNSATFVDLTGLSITVTPRSAKSRFLLVACLVGTSANANVFAAVKFQRNGTDVEAAPAAGVRVPATFDAGGSAGSDACVTSAFCVHDAPNTTAALTYKLVMATRPGFNYWLNRSSVDSDTTNYARYKSMLLLIEYND